MGEVAFDTIAEVRRLRDVGFVQEQAEAITRSIHIGVTGGVATRTDLGMAETGLRAEIGKVDAGLRAEIERVDAGLRVEIERAETGLRADMERLETGLRADMERLEAGLRAEIGTVRSEIERAETGLRAEIGTVRSELSVVRNDMLWIKLIGGAVLAVLVLPWLADIAGIAFSR